MKTKIFLFSLAFLSIFLGAKLFISNTENNNLKSLQQGAAINSTNTFENSSVQARKAEQECHPSYKGVCLDPYASDYDCVNGSGNGPFYTGRVRVIGPDIFGLDKDGDGWGCE